MRTSAQRLPQRGFLGLSFHVPPTSVGIPRSLVSTGLSYSQYPWTTEKALLLQDPRPPLRTSASKLQEIHEKAELWTLES